MTAIKAKLEAQTGPWPFEVFDGAPAGVSSPYICIWDQTGSTIRSKYASRIGQVYFPFQLSCVARTKEGLRDLVKIARHVVLWAPVEGASLIVEDGSNPILPETVGGDQRFTAPLTMHCFLPA